MLEVVWLNRGIHLSICFLVSGFQYSISSLDKNRGQPSSCGHLFADQTNRSAVDHCIFVCVCVIVFVFLSLWLCLCVIVFVFLSLWSLICYPLQQIGMLMAVVCARRHSVLSQLSWAFSANRAIYKICPFSLLSGERFCDRVDWPFVDQGQAFFA